MNTSPSRLILRISLWLAFVWLAVLALSYDAIRNPFTGAAGVIQGDVLDVLAVAAVVTLGGAIGAAFLRNLDPFSPLEQAALQAILGLGAISLIVLLLGLVGWFPMRWMAWVATLAALAALFRPAIRWLRALGSGLRESFQLPEYDYGRQFLGTFSGWVIIASLALLAAALIVALAPVSEWDSLVYHLAGPQLFIQSGRIVAFPELHFLGFPLLTEMLYLWLMLLARPQSATLLHASFGLIPLMLVVGMARRLNRPLAGWLAVLTILVNADFLGGFHRAMSDFSAAAYATGALWLILAAFHREGETQTRLLVWAGVFAGLMLGTKYSSAGAALGLGVLTLWLARRRGIGGILRAGGTLALAGLLLFLPWMVKDMLMYGNPLAPFLWGTSTFDRIDQADYLQAGSGLRGWEFITFPLKTMLLGDLKAWPYSASPGPLLPGVIPLALFGWRQRPRAERDFILRASIFAGVAGLIWLVGAATSIYLASFRLLFPVVPAAALVAGLGLEGLRDITLPIPIYRLARVVIGLAALGSVALALISHITNPDALRVSLGFMPTDEYLAEALPAYYSAIQQVNSLPPSSRVLMLWESRIFYCQRVCIPDTLLNRWHHDLRVQPDPRQIAQTWRANGITYVLIFDAGMWNLLPPFHENVLWLTADDITKLEIVRQKDLQLVWSNDVEAIRAYSLYKVTPPTP